MRPILRDIMVTIFAFVLLSGVAVFVAQQVRQRPIRLHYDGGGEISDHIKFFKYLAEAHIKVEIDGDCVSACTLVLSLPPGQVCIYPTGRLGFHLATDGTGKPMPDVTASLVSRFYPPAVQEWIKKHGPLKSEPIYLYGAEAISLGILPACEAGVLDGA